MITKLMLLKNLRNAGCKMILTRGTVNNPIQKLEKINFIQFLHHLLISIMPKKMDIE